MSKNEETTNKSELVANKIVLKSSFGPVGQKYYIQPCPDKYGHLPSCVRRVNSAGDMILSDADKNDPESQFLIPEDATITFESGKEFDLDDPYQRNQWEAIKNCKLIAPDRMAKGPDGNYLIDGSERRYGVAELYVYKPGVAAETRINRKRLAHKAANYIFEDTPAHQRTMTKIMGKHMDNMIDQDVQDYLLTIAEKDPQRTINLYEAADTNFRILLMDALNKHVIIRKNKFYMYGDDITLGVTDDAAVAWLANKDNISVRKLIQKETYPDLEGDPTFFDSPKLTDEEKKDNKKK